MNTWSYKAVSHVLSLSFSLSLSLHLLNICWLHLFGTAPAVQPSEFVLLGHVPFSFPRTRYSVHQDQWHCDPRLISEGSNTWRIKIYAELRAQSLILKSSDLASNEGPLTHQEVNMISIHTFKLRLCKAALLFHCGGPELLPLVL